MSRVVTLPPAADRLEDGAVVGGWWRTLEDDRLLCELCPRACHLKSGDRGFCFVRENRDGQMVLSTYGRSTGFCIDPIEKKPLNHFYPGTSVLSFGTAGCNLGCKFCQNWDISKSREIERASQRATPEAIVAAARHWGCQSVAFTYNDPVIWAEYAVDTARLCRQQDIKTVAVTAGYITPAAREYFFSAMDAANVDLKGFTEEFYFHYTLSHLQPVLETLQWLKRETNVWFEITNLMIPQANDAAAELEQMCDWILAHVGDEVPVHFTAFHPDFRLRDRGPTPPETLLAAYEIARRCGLKFVYVGNVHDVAHQSTYCPACQQLLIERNWYQLGVYHLRGSRCAACDAPIAGHFAERPGDWGSKRMPVRIGEFATQESPQTRAAVASSAVVPSNVAPARVGRPRIPADQQQSLHAAACRWLGAALAGRTEFSTDLRLGAAAEMILEGAFVTLKRQQHLRACCGVLGRPLPLAEAVHQAAVRTATGDTRLPPLSLDELAYCDVDVTLLHQFQATPADAAARLAAVEIGRHGLQIRRGEQSGLLLPVVAVEHGWNAEQFLQHVCRKAGLPSTAWSAPDTQLLTFEGTAVSAPYRVEELSGLPTPLQLEFTADELAALADHCRRNVVAHSIGGTPSYYLPGISDGTVYGVALSLVHPRDTAPLHLSSFSLRRGMPLQATLLNFTSAAARQLEPLGLTRSELNACRTGVTILSDVALHGTLAEPDLRGLDPARRALVVIERDRSAWIYHPHRTGAELIDEIARVARVQHPPAAQLYSSRVQSSEPYLVVSNAPRPITGPATRPPAVAGTFYPASYVELARLVDGLFSTEPPVRQRCRAAMVPHAGLVYSGRIAAQVLERLEIPETVLVLGPKHTRLGVPWAVAPHATWSIPGGEIPSDPELARHLAESIPGLQLDAAAHQREHAIEVELPLLHRVAPHARVVGLALGPSDLESCRKFGERLAAVIASLDSPPLLLISSDMNHFANDDENRRLDALALSAMATLQPEQLYETVTQHNISMCGVVPAVIVMIALQRLGGLDHFHQVAYGTSAETSGDRSRVVGYAGVLLK